jgi:hypothetical protein
MKIPSVIFCCAFLLALPLFAREKSDVLVMNNGDRLTCEIKGLDAGVLYVGLDYIKGTSSVDWSKVHHLESKQLFMVKTEDGSVYTGTLSSAETGDARPRQIEVAESAEKTVVLEQPKIVLLDQNSTHFWKRLNGSFNSGLIYAKGNQSTQYTLNAQVEYPRERWSTGLAFNSTLSGTVGRATSTRNNPTFYFRRLLRWDNWFYTGLGSLLQSSEQNIQRQTNIGGGIGRYLKNTNHAKVALMGGMAWQNTRYDQTAVQQANQNVAAAMIGADVELFKFDKTNLAITGAVFPAISQPGRVFTDMNATYSIKFFSNFTWNFSFYGNWDNRPPGGFSGSDYGTSSGFGWTFGNK